MTEVNTLAYINTPPEPSTSGTKAYTDTSNDFGSVLETANKAYKAEENKSPQKNETAENHNCKQSDKNHEVKKEDINSDKEKTSSTRTEDKKTNEETAKKPQSEEKIDENSEETASSNQAENLAGIKNIIAKAIEVLSSKEIPAKEILAEVAEKLTQLKQKITDKQLKDVEKELDVDLSKLTKDLKSLTQSNAKVQTQTQQVILNLQSENAPNKSINTQKQSEEQTAASTAKTPQVQASADIKTDTNVKMTKQSVKEALEQSGLTQELFDKTNAKVVSVESSTSADNLLNRNPQEQGIKLSLENAANPANSTSTASASTFDKSLDTVSQPKELSKTDILSQIHTKLDQVKDEGTTKVTIVLKPENLGKISLELVSGKDGLTARMTTDNAQVKDLLDKNLDSLRTSLGSQGINVNNVTVKVAETQSASGETLSFEQNEAGKGENSKQGHESNNRGELPDEEEILNQAFYTNEEENQTTAHNGQIDYKV